MRAPTERRRSPSARAAKAVDKVARRVVDKAAVVRAVAVAAVGRAAVLPKLALRRRMPRLQPSVRVIRRSRRAMDSPPAAGKVEAKAEARVVVKVAEEVKAVGIKAVGVKAAAAAFSRA